MSERHDQDNSADDQADQRSDESPLKRKVQDPENARSVDTGKSWLAVCVFLFTSGYLLISFDEPLFNQHALLFVAFGVVAAKVFLDFPGQYLHGAMTLQMIKGKSGSELIRAVEKAGAFGTFIKAAIVVAAYVATKMAFSWYFMPTLASPVTGG